MNRSSNEIARPVLWEAGSSDGWLPIFWSILTPSIFIDFENSSSIQIDCYTPSHRSWTKTKNDPGYRDISDTKAGIYQWIMALLTSRPQATVSRNSKAFAGSLLTTILIPFSWLGMKNKLQPKIRLILPFSSTSDLDFNYSVLIIWIGWNPCHWRSWRPIPRSRSPTLPWTKDHPRSSYFRFESRDLVVRADSHPTLAGRLYRKRTVLIGNFRHRFLLYVTKHWQCSLVLLNQLL